MSDTHRRRFVPALIVGFLTTSATTWADVSVNYLWQSSLQGAITSGTWNFYNDGITDHGALLVDIPNGVTGATDCLLMFNGQSTLTASSAGALSGDAGQLFLDHSSLTITAANAITGTSVQVFRNSAILYAAVPNAVSGGTQGFENTSTLNATAAAAVSGGLQVFSDFSALNANVTNAVSGASLSFYDNSTLNAAATHALIGTTITLVDSSLIYVSAADAFGPSTSIVFSDLTGASGFLQLNGHDSTLGAISSTQGLGVIHNRSSTAATLTISPAASTSYSGLIEDGAISNAAPLSIVKSGPGLLVLGGSLTYTGATTIAAGTLSLQGTQSNMLSHTHVTIQAGGTLFGGNPSNNFHTLHNLALQGGTLAGVNPDATHGNFLLTGTTTATGDTQSVISAPVVRVGTHVFDVADGAAAVDLLVSSQIKDAPSDVGFIRKTGAGTLALTGASTTTGLSSLDAGTVIASGNNSLGAGGVVINLGGTLAGTALLHTVVTVSGKISPGNPGDGPGTLGTGDTYFSALGTYVWEISSATGTAGTDWDLLAVTGTLVIASFSPLPFTISLHSLNGDTPGNAANFDPQSNYTWVIASAAGIDSFTPSAFALDTSNFSNAVNPSSSWRIEKIGTTVAVTYTAVPEPQVWMCLLIACSIGTIGACRRQQI